MEKQKKSFWTVIVVGAFATLMAFFGGGSAFARGGRGGFGGGGGGRGGRGAGANARAAIAASRGGQGNNNKNNKRKEEQARERREERLARVAEARIIYAKRERQAAWDKETDGRFRGDVKSALDGATE